MAGAPSSSPQPRRTALLPPPPPPPLLLLVSLLVLLVAVVAGHATAARVPLEAEASSRSQEQYRDVVYEEKARSFTFTAGGDDGRCGGGAGAEGEDVEECLMRRTLVAHTDYIYTQGGGHN